MEVRGRRLAGGHIGIGSWLPMVDLTSGLLGDGEEPV
jgi:hypothetical protein